MYLKQKQRKPYGRNSFHFNKIYVATVVDDGGEMTETFLQEPMETPTSAEGVLSILHARDFDAPYYLTFSDTIDKFLKELAAGQVEAGYIGKNSKPGWAWPSLAGQDGNHLCLRAPRTESNPRCIMSSMSSCGHACVCPASARRERARQGRRHRVPRLGGGPITGVRG